MRVRVPVVATALVAASSRMFACNPNRRRRRPISPRTMHTRAAAPAAAARTDAARQSRFVSPRDQDRRTPMRRSFSMKGSTLLYGFNHEESFKSFALAAAKDAASPMPHWGMALALGTNINDVAPAERLKQGYTHLARSAEAEGRAAATSSRDSSMRSPSATSPIRPAIRWCASRRTRRRWARCRRSFPTISTSRRSMPKA